MSSDWITDDERRALRKAYRADYDRGIRHPIVKRSLEERLYEKVDRLYGDVPDIEGWELGPCWPWMGATNEDGYGVIRGDETAREPDPDGKRRAPLLLAHRVALSLALGRPLGVELLARHKCDVRRCCRPLHLHEGTAQQNVDDMIARGRDNPWNRRAPIKRRRLG